MVNINIVNAVKELIKRKFYGSSACIIRLTRPSCPRQANGYDCGVFMLKNIESIMLNKPLLSFNANEALEDRNHFMELVAVSNQLSTEVIACLSTENVFCYFLAAT